MTEIRMIGLTKIRKKKMTVKKIVPRKQKIILKTSQNPLTMNRKKPAGKFVPKHLRGGNESSSSRPTLPNSSLINQGLRGPGGRRMFQKEPPKTESHSEFPTKGERICDSILIEINM